MSSQPEYILAGALMKQHLAGVQTVGALSIFENGAQALHVHRSTFMNTMTRRFTC